MATARIPSSSGPLTGALQRIQGSRRMRGTALYLLVLLLCAVGQFLPQQDKSFFALLERGAFDMQMRWLREISPTTVDNDAVLIGLDDASIRIFPEPIALWHRHLAQTLIALAQTKPAAVGVDVVLPERSFEQIMPGGDSALFRGIRQLLQQDTPVIFARTLDSKGQPLEVHAIYERLLGEAGMGMDQQLADPGFIARRFDEAEVGHATLVGQLLRALKRPVNSGLIDYSIGSQIDYVPIQDVIGWLESGNSAELERRFSGRIVLIGSVWEHMDRWMLPVKISAWEKSEGDLGFRQSGVVVHLQALRSQLAGGLITPLPAWFSWMVVLAAAGIVFVRPRPLVVLIAAIGAPLAAGILSLALLRTQQILLPLATLVVTIWLGLIARSVLDAVRGAAERLRLKRSFAGQVSPAVMEEIMKGRLAPGSSAHLLEVCVIFSDIRGFTTLSESLSPEAVMSVLQRYFDRMVKAVYRFDGTIDKFIGDGMMILFGAPRALADPCSDAVRCALAMLHELDELNQEFALEGLPGLVIGIGINYGKVVVGNIGSTERHNYSAIGDAVNVAARMEGLTKELSRKILISQSVVSRIGDRFNFESLGERLIKGHSPVMVWGIRTSKAGTTAGTKNGGTATPVAAA